MPPKVLIKLRRKSQKKKVMLKLRRKSGASRQLSRSTMGRLTSLTLKRGCGFPDRFTTCVAYSGQFVLDTAGSGAPSLRVFRGNGAYDPVHAAAAGNKCAYFDQFAALYQTYMCWGSSIDIRFVNVETIGSAPDANTFAVMPSRNESLPTPWTAVMEETRSKYRVIKDAKDGTYRMFHSAKTRQILPAGRNNYSSTLISATNSIPQDQWYWLVACNGIDGLTDAKFTCLFKIKYYVTFYERKNIPPQAD